MTLDGDNLPFRLLNSQTATLLLMMNRRMNKIEGRRQSWARKRKPKWIEVPYRNVHKKKALFSMMSGDWNLTDGKNVALDFVCYVSWKLYDKSTPAAVGIPRTIFTPFVFAKRVWVICTRVKLMAVSFTYSARILWKETHNLNIV